MADPVVVVLGIAKNFPTARLEHVSRKFFPRRLAGAPRYRYNRFIPFAVGRPCKVLQSFYRVIDKNEPVFHLGKLGSVLFESIATQDAGYGSLLQSRDRKFGRIVKISIKTVPLIIRLRQRKKNVARPDLAGIDHKGIDVAVNQGGT